MSLFMVDVETDGPCPGIYSMIELGCVLVEPGLNQTFYAKLRPDLTAKWDPEALKVSGRTRIETLDFPYALEGMKAFATWIAVWNKERARFISDNNGFDWQFVNYYFHKYVGANPFGHSSINLGSLYKGLVGDVTKNFDHLRRPEPEGKHDALDGAIINAEVLLHLGMWKLKGVV